jgi:hypothetical protein
MTRLLAALILSSLRDGRRSVAPPRGQLWSDPSTWGGSVPGDGAQVTIALGQTVIIDVDTASLSTVTNMGTVEVQDGHVGERVITCSKWLNMGGTLRIGTSEAQPYQSKVRFVFTDAYPGDGARAAHSQSGMGFTLAFARGMMTMDGGKVYVYGKYPTQPWTKLNATANAAATALTLKDDVGAAAVPWNTGDQIIVGPDQYHHSVLQPYFSGADTTRGRSYVHTLAGVSGTGLTLTAGLTSKRWGQRQWATGNGFSTDSANAVAATAFALGQTYIPNDAQGTARLADINAAIAAGLRHEIDERTPVANLTRNIVFECPNDAAWLNSGFGCNVMAMRGTTFHFQGVEVRRGGQRDLHGRYPIHMHMMSLGQVDDMDASSEADNTYVGGSLVASYADASVKGCAVHDSWNRGIVIHGTNGVPIHDNVVARVKSHGYFIEDGVERRNDFQRCLALQCEQSRRDPGETGWDVNVEGSLSHAIQRHDTFHGFGPAGFWITNPDNNFIDCHAAQAPVGFWWSHAPQFHNLSYPFTLQNKPVNELFGTVSGNTAHSCAEHNMRLELAPLDRWTGGSSNNEAGPQTTRYQAMGPGSVTGITNPAYRPQLIDSTNYKGFLEGYLNRASWSDYTGWVSGDHAGAAFAGASGETTQIGKALIFGASLNNDIDPTTASYGGSPLYTSGLASYNFGVSFVGNVFLNMPGADGSTSGAMSLTASDLYTRPVELGMYVSTGNALLNSFGGYRRQSENLSGGRLSRSGALYDPDGFWHPDGAADTWWNVFDVPFLTSGKTTYTLAGITGQLLADGGPSGYHGIGDFAMDVISTGATCTQANAWTTYDYGAAPATAEYLDWQANYGAMGGLSGEIAFSVARVQSDYTTSIGTWSVAHGRPIRGSLSNMRHAALAKGGFFKWDAGAEYTVKPSTVWMTVTNCHRVGDGFTLGVRLSTAPDGVFAYGRHRAVGGNMDRNDAALATNFPSVASLAALTAHAGNAYHWDGTHCWVKVAGNPCPGGVYETQATAQASDYKPWTLAVGQYV